MSFSDTSVNSLTEGLERAILVGIEYKNALDSASAESSLEELARLADTAGAEVVATTSTLLVFAALYQLSDGIQNVSVGILRGIQDVKIIMPIALVSYWLLNLPVGYLLGFTLGMGPSGLYLGFAVGLSTAAVLLIARIRRSVGKLRAAN